MSRLAGSLWLTAGLVVAGCAHHGAGEGPSAADPSSAPPPVIAPPPRTPPPTPVDVADTASMPKQGDYVYVRQLPEALTRVAPNYPASARAAGIDGVVMLQALVGKDGAVHDVRVVKSIPELDGAAMACMRQWKFKPAMDEHGQPVTVWVGVPIKFTLH